MICRQPFFRALVSLNAISTAWRLATTVFRPLTLLRTGDINSIERRESSSKNNLFHPSLVVPSIVFLDHVSRFGGGTWALLVWSVAERAVGTNNWINGRVSELGRQIYSHEGQRRLPKTLYRESILSTTSRGRFCSANTPGRKEGEKTGSTVTSSMDKHACFLLLCTPIVTANITALVSSQCCLN